MGTSQRISPGVLGETNWGALSRGVTQIAKTVESENDEREDSSTSGVGEEEHLRFGNILTKRRVHLKNTYRSLVNTAGGGSKVSKGQSGALGRAGVKSAQKIASFLVAAGGSSLTAALEDIGISLIGKNLQDVLAHLLVYIADSNAGMDETAANKATCEILNDLANKSANDLQQFEANIKTITTDSQLPEILCDFWGYYIFEHLSQKFYEKVAQERGREIGIETFRIIKEDILGQVKRLNLKRNISTIDWKGNQGKIEIEKIFNSIIKILCDED